MDNKILKIKQTIKNLEGYIDLIHWEAEENDHATNCEKIEALIEYWEAELLKL